MALLSGFEKIVRQAEPLAMQTWFQLGGPAEYFIIGLLALCLIATLSETSLLRGLISGGLGLLISFMGYDIITGELRFNFGFEYLEDRIHFVIVVIGVFGVAQCMRFSETVGSISRSA